MRNLSGIYSITNLETGHYYVGSACKLGMRKYKHFSMLRNGNHHSRHLQNAFNKYGEQNFIFEILELVSDKKELISREQFYLNFTKPEYNILKEAKSSLGIKRSAEYIQKQKITKTGKPSPLSKEQIQSIVQKRSWYKHSAETIEKFSSKQRGIIRTPEQNKNTSDSVKKAYALKKSLNPLYKSGENNPAWKGGAKPNNCLICKKPIGRRSKKCKNCQYL